MKIGSNNTNGRFINSTVHLDSDEIVSSRKIALEFKNVLFPSNQPTLDLDPPGIKVAEIYNQYISTNSKSAFNPIGRATYTILKKNTYVNNSKIIDPSNDFRKRIEKKYQIGGLFSIGKLVDCVG